MNYPAHIEENAVLKENEVIVNLVNVISTRGDLNPDFVRTLKSSNSFNTALGFVRSNGGVSENILEANKINVQAYHGRFQVPVLKDTTVVESPQIVQSQPIPLGFTPAPQYSFQTGQIPTYSQSRIAQISNFNQPAYRVNSFQYSSPGTSTNFGYQPSSNFGYQPIKM